MKIKNTIKAFTIIELIITIVILAILGTISLIAYNEYSKDSRNTVRIVDIGSINKALELFYTQSGFYPDPDNYIERKYEVSPGVEVVLWKQGEIGPNVIRNLNILIDQPLDPLYFKSYTYSVSYDNKTYQIGAINEE